MAENTYSVAAKWWVDQAREVNENYEIGLAEELFKDFEEELTVIIKDTVEDCIKSNSEFLGLSLRANLNILNDAFRNSKIRCTLPGLPTHYVMSVSQNLVFVRDLDVPKRCGMFLPFIDTDQVLFDAR